MSATLTSIQLNATVQTAVVPNVSTLTGNIIVKDTTNAVVSVGSAAGNADGSYTTTGSVVSGTPVVIDFTSLKDPYGNALTVGHIVALKITNANTSGSGVLEHGGGTNPIYAAVPSGLYLGFGDFFAQSFNGLGLTVTSGSLQNLTLTASTGTIAYKVTALVRSA